MTHDDAHGAQSSSSALRPSVTVRVILLASLCALGGPALASLAGPEGGIQVRRFPLNPVIRP